MVRKFCIFFLSFPSAGSVTVKGSWRGEGGAEVLPVIQFLTARGIRYHALTAPGQLDSCMHGGGQSALV